MSPCNDILPLFSSHGSIGRSILTLESPDKVKPTGPASIIKIALDNKLKDVYICETNFSGFIDAYKACDKYKLNLHWGLKLILCDDAAKKDEESLKSEHKCIIWMLNSEGYKPLIKIYSRAACEGFYYCPRLDCKTLVEMWDKNLACSVPFFDSFLHKNTLSFSQVVPNWSQIRPTFFYEPLHELPFCPLIQSAVEQHCKANKYEMMPVHSIFYPDKKSFKSYVVFRCINNRSVFSSPDISHLSDNSFCFETYLDYVKSEEL